MYKDNKQIKVLESKALPMITTISLIESFIKECILILLKYKIKYIHHISNMGLK